MTSLSSAPTGARRRRGRSASRSLARSIPLLPGVVLLGVFMAGPIVTAIVGSFTDSSLTGAAASSSSWVGLQNYIDLFTSPDFPNAVWLTVVFVLVSGVIGQNVVGMVLALLLRSGSRRVGGFVSTFVIAAWVLPEIVGAFAGYAFFSEDGTLNAVLAGLGLETVPWLYAFPMMSVIIANIWRGSAMSMMIYSAALQGIPAEITEAAEIDGASGIKRFFLVTLPMIRSSIATNMMLIVLHTLSVFTLIWVMTVGGPGNSSTTLPVLAYQEAFKYSQLGYGTAIAAVMLVVGAIFSVMYLRALRTDGGPE
ncbi:carbohydrate ABC transporter permease [Homoserinibacter sp. YIM 151385]|uniref:carbohydrate ABC transporter permease n=1 Tax=Homoserinibacter sp. YIM 151385 TaxID=2985506 RepID=UPI0022F01A0C|nr:sugar ABC transporter permease [Homoserinibacter sp. YIM 151385]WBU37532.1 sugar ABC transporter permease [Homoserinibacter sp. YIM 151385]